MLQRRREACRDRPTAESAVRRALPATRTAGARRHAARPQSRGVELHGPERRARRRRAAGRRGVGRRRSTIDAERAADLGRGARVARGGRHAIRWHRARRRRRLRAAVHGAAAPSRPAAGACASTRRSADNHGSAWSRAGPDLVVRDAHGPPRAAGTGSSTSDEWPQRGALRAMAFTLGSRRAARSSLLAIARGGFVLLYETPHARLAVRAPGRRCSATRTSSPAPGRTCRSAPPPTARARRPRPASACARASPPPIPQLLPVGSVLNVATGDTATTASTRSWTPARRCRAGSSISTCGAATRRWRSGGKDVQVTVLRLGWDPRASSPTPDRSPVPAPRSGAPRRRPSPPTSEIPTRMPHRPTPVLRRPADPDAGDGADSTCRLARRSRIGHAADEAD